MTELEMFDQQVREARRRRQAAEAAAENSKLLRLPMISVSWTKVHEPTLGDLWEATATSYDRLVGIVPDYCALLSCTAKEKSRDRNRAIGFALESVAKKIIAATYERDAAAPTFSPTAGEGHGK